MFASTIIIEILFQMGYITCGVIEAEIAMMKKLKSSTVSKSMLYVVNQSRNMSIEQKRIVRYDRNHHASLVIQNVESTNLNTMLDLI